jgi:predicted transcriptional regulator
MSKEKLGAKVALKAQVKKIVAKEHQAIEYIGAILKDLLADGHSQRSIVDEWSLQSGRTISQSTVSQYVAIASSKSGANAQALLKAVQGKTLSVEQVRTLTPAKAKELNLMSAPVRKVRTPKPKAKANAQAPADSINAIKKAIETGKTLSSQDRANAIKATQALLEMLIATS